MAKNYARTFGQDLMRGEHVVGEKPAQRTVVNGPWSNHPRYYEQKCAAEAKLDRSLTPDEFERDHFVVPDSEIQSGTSIFDPVLCELSYRWFCPPGGSILDPFAGGSVRGIVASCLGFAYTGVELRAAQVDANRAQAGIATGPAPTWVNADSRNIADAAPGAYDMLFSCPPYADLEVYSDNPADLSTLPYADFMAAYEQIIAASCALLKDDRFAVFVVGDVRGKDGAYYGFPEDTVAAFAKAGLKKYNEAVLVTSAGSLPIRVGKQFRASRKLGKTHQNVLCFVKGDAKKAALACDAANDNAVPVDA